MNRFNLKDVICEQIAINIRDKSTYIEFLNYLAKQDIRWSVGDIANSEYHMKFWDKDKEEFCLSLSTGALKYANIKCYTEKGFKIIEYKGKKNNINIW